LTLTEKEKEKEKKKPYCVDQFEMNGKGGEATRLQNQRLPHLMLVSMVRRRSEVNIEGGVCGARLRLATHPTPDGMLHDLENLRNLFSSIGLVEWASDELPLLSEGC